MGWLFVSAQPIGAEESPAFEKIRDASPDGKFAVRILCSAEPEDPDRIYRSLITAVELVSLPSKKEVVKLLQNEGGVAGFERAVWSKDSNWFAVSFSPGLRVTDTYVYHRSGDDFTELETEHLRVDAKGDVRNEYVNPIRWVKPGVLLLEQFDIFRGGSGDATYRFTAKFDDKTGKFEITSKKKVPSKE